MKELVTWRMENDKTILDSAVELTNAQAHHHYLNEVLQWSVEEIQRKTRDRMNHFLKALTIMNTDFHGTVLEAGCGTGVLSASISKFPKVEKVIALDYSKAYVDEVFPVVSKRFGADQKKITRVHGSFNALELEDECVDFIVSTGTLHHSEDLLKTAEESYRVLKPGGWCIHADRIFGSTNSRITDKTGLNKPLPSEKLSFRYGEGYASKEITSEMNSTHWLHLCEIEYPYLKQNFIIRSIPMIEKRKITNFILYLTYKLFGNFLLQHVHKIFNFNIPIYPWYTHEGNFKGQNYKNLLFLCQKPLRKAQTENENKSFLQILFHYIFHLNHKLDKKYIKDLKIILKI